MKVSIIIPVYKVETTIERCLRSVASQTYSGPLECIIIDDASPDESMKFVRAFINQCRSQVEWHTLTHDHNKGLSEARNTGIAAATGDYLFFLDSDDEIPSCSIASLTALAEKYPGVNVVQGNLIVVPETTGLDFDIRRHHFPEYVDDNKWIENKMLAEIPVMVWNKLFCRDWLILNSFSFRKGVVHEDEHWRYQTLGKVGSIAFCPEITYIYHMNEASITHAAYKDRGAVSMLEIYNEFFDRINHPSHWLHILRVLCGFMSPSGQLEFPQEYLKGFKALVERILSEKKLPLKARLAYSYVLKPSCFKLLYLKLLHHSTYGLLRDSLNGFRSPFE